MNKNGWTGTQFYCSFCGHKLIEEEKQEEKYFDEFKTEKEYNDYLKTLRDSFDYHCSNNDCFYHTEGSLTLFHPIYESSASDSWAIGYIK